MTANDPSGLPERPGRLVICFVASLLLFAGVALLLTGHWWSHSVIDLLEKIPGGKWLTVPVPYLPLIAVAFGVRLLARSAGTRR